MCCGKKTRWRRLVEITETEPFRGQSCLLIVVERIRRLVHIMWLKSFSSMAQQRGIVWFDRGSWNERPVGSIARDTGWNGQTGRVRGTDSATACSWQEVAGPGSVVIYGGRICP